MDFDKIVITLIIAIESAGIMVIVIASITAVIKYIFMLPRPRFEKIRLDLAKGLSLGLEFKVGSEILRTVIVRSFSEVGFLAAIIIVRSLLNFLIHREMVELKEEVEENDRI